MPNYPIMHKGWQAIRALFKRHWRAFGVFFLLFVVWYFSLPARLFDDPASTVIEDSQGVLLGARIADDGQWRFPEVEEVPERYSQSVVCFEDRYFFCHPGFNPVSLASALMHNLQAGRIVRGGSTISMQLIRLSRKGKPRTVKEKIVEIFLATRLEMRYSKRQILALYASHAPFGGNTVGIDAASWRYFGRPSGNLSWAEAATLAVLPNAPSMIYPGRNQEILKLKRDWLLERLHHCGKIDSLTLSLSKQEALPGSPHPIPQLAPHLLDRAVSAHKGQRIRTTLSAHLQQRASAIVEEHSRVLKSNFIHNASAVILEVKSGDVLAYVGNTTQPDPNSQGAHVDLVMANRSTGSILKPFLYLAMMNEGQIMPNTLVPDIPTQISGFSPKNFFPDYDGAVPASKSLSRSLNVPSVRMLRDYGVEKFHLFLRELGLTSIDKGASHYGLSLILGGAEGSLWEIAGTYASLSRVLSNYAVNRGRYNPSDFRMPQFLQADDKHDRVQLVSEGVTSAAAIWLCWKALIEVNRPESESGWRMLSSQGKIAWKTGTSFGGRDAWAIGTSREYVVGVWAGNATGEGRPGLTGTGAAAPVMFDLFGLLPASNWFEQPFAEMEYVGVCRESGHRPGRYCTQIDSIWVHPLSLNTPACPYHRLIHLDPEGRFRVNSQCESVSAIVPTPWFILPPAMEWFFMSKNPAYKPLPPYRGDCLPEQGLLVMELIYPGSGHAVYVPREIDGSAGKVVFEAAHRNRQARIFWHLDEEYIGETLMNHRMALSPGSGYHTLTLVDDEGHRVSRVFEVASRH